MQHPASRDGGYPIVAYSTMPQRNNAGNRKDRRLATPQSVNAAIKAICDIMRRSNCAGALQYVPELTWILFLRILDEREAREARRPRRLGPNTGRRS